MRYLRKKYRLGIAITFLFSYLFLFTESIFHIHHYSFERNATTFNLKIKNNSDPFALDHSFCLLEHLCNTINFNGFTDKDIIFFISSIDFSSKLALNNFSNYSTNITLLRAPPRELPEIS